MFSSAVPHKAAQSAAHDSRGTACGAALRTYGYPARPSERTGDASGLSRNALQAVAELGQPAPARVGELLLVPVRLVVQVAAADRAEAGAVGAAKDLVRERERGRVTRPARQVEAIVGDVLGGQLLGVAGTRRLVLARGDRQVEHGVVEAPVAGPVEPDPEPQLEQGARARAADHELGRHLLGHREIALAAELEGLELELDLVAILLAGAELDRPKIEHLHSGHGSSRRRRRP